MTRRSLVGAAGALVLVAGLLPALAAPAQATPAGDGLVISEVYLNGGSSGATYLNKYVEIHNPTEADIDVSGWSVQYRSYSSTGTFTGVIALGEHHVEPGGALLVGGNSNASNGEALPTPDVASTIAFSGNANGGTLALVKRSTALTGDRAAVLGDDDLVDLVGYGASTAYEGSGPAPREYSVTSSLHRAEGRDTDDNAADFTGGDPTPKACGEACDGGVVTPPDPPVTATIAEIQGTGDASPLAGRTVTTRGVVTATYPTGGFDGAYIQTGWHRRRPSVHSRRPTACSPSPRRSPRTCRSAISSRSPARSRSSSGSPRSHRQLTAGRCSASRPRPSSRPSCPSPWARRSS